MKNKKANDGSALIGAIMIAAVLSVVAAGFIRVSTIGANNEAASYIDEQAFQAGESGVIMGARWLRDIASFPSSGAASPFSSYLTINNMDVVVSIAYGTSGSSTEASISAAVFKDPSGNHAQNASTFIKRIRMTKVTQECFGKYVTLVDAVINDANWSGYANRIFSGRFHSNSRIKISADPSTSSKVVFKDGLVTVGTTSNYNGNYGIGAHDNNNYNSGVLLNWSGGTARNATACDAIFTGQYRSNVDNIAMPTSVTSDTLAHSSSAVTLPTSSVDEGSGQANYRPTLVFSVVSGTPTATYYYKTNATTYQKKTYTNYSGSILVSSNNLNVYGTVSGKVTVSTAVGKDIVPVGSLVYSDFNISTLSVPSTSTNVIGLVSGNNIVFNQGWKRDTSKTTTTTVTMSGTYNINASLMAVQSNSAKSGCTWWDSTKACNYNVNVYGNQIMRAYRPITYNNTYGAMGTVGYYHDARLENASGVQPPGFPKVQTSSGLWILEMNGWKEENTY